MQKIFPCLDIKKIFSPPWNVQQETIFSFGKSFASINPWDCLEVGVKNLFDKLNPIVISRFVKVFSRYNYYSEPYKSNMIETIKKIKKNKLSTNTKEVLDAIIDWLIDVI